MMRFYITLIACFIASSAAGQINFNGFDVTNFDIVKNEKFSQYKNKIYVRTEDIGKFDAILVYTQEKKFVFADQHGEDTTFKNVYAELVDRFGKEDKNRDSIPSYYHEKEKGLSYLRILVRKKRARIHRMWRLSDHSVNNILLIWNEGGLTLIFDSGG